MNTSFDHELFRLNHGAEQIAKILLGAFDEALLIYDVGGVSCSVKIESILGFGDLGDHCILVFYMGVCGVGCLYELNVISGDLSVSGTGMMIDCSVAGYVGPHWQYDTLSRKK